MARYLVECQFVEPHATHTSLATLCLNYVTFPCFDVEMDAAKRQGFVRNGDFAFQDYAATHWLDHLAVAAKSSAPDPTASAIAQMEGDFDLAIADFAAVYAQDLKADEGDGLQPHDRFRDRPCYEDLCAVLRSACFRNLANLDGLDEISPHGLGQAVVASRTVLESLVAAHGSVSQQDERQKLSSFYGKKWFRCSKATCYYFHEGFVDARSRKAHMDRHERPFRCTEPSCEEGFRLGFAKKKDLEKHTSVHHPETGNIKVTFARLRTARAETKIPQAPKPTKHPARFRCQECDKIFTRRSILRDHHSNVHVSDEKSHVCGYIDCGRAFARLNDLKRHMTNKHKQFICGGTAEKSAERSKWGCGRSFANLETFVVHLLSQEVCIQPLQPRAFIHDQLSSAVNRARDELRMIPIPQAFLNARPALRDILEDCFCGSGGILENRGLKDASSPNVESGHNTKSYWTQAREVASNFFERRPGSTELAGFRQFTNYLQICNDAGVDETDPVAVLAYFDKRIKECES